MSLDGLDAHLVNFRKSNIGLFVLCGAEFKTHDEETKMDKSQTFSAINEI